MSNNDDQFDDGLESFDEIAVDEFGNDIDPADESFAEEDWDSYDEQSDDGADDQPQAQSKKKSGNFNKIVIGLALLAGIGVLVFQLMGGNPASAPVPAPAPVAAAPAPQTPRPPDNSNTPPSGFLTSPENMAALEQDIAKTYSETEIAEFEDGAEMVAPADEAMAPPMPNAMTPEEPAPAPIPSASAPVLPQSSSMDNLASAPTLEETTPVLEPDPEISAPESAIRMPSASDVLLKQPTETVPAIAAADPSAALVEKIDLVLTRIDQLENDVRLLKAQTETASSKEIDALRESLTALEKKIDGPQEAPMKQAPTPAAKTADNAEPRPQILGSSVSEAAPKLKATPQKLSGAWVLKGAQPGRAMVARPGENEMRTVEIGDTLPGIGQITGISYQGGRWLVQGTQGRITQ